MSGMTATGMPRGLLSGQIEALVEVHGAYYLRQSLSNELLLAVGPGDSSGKDIARAFLFAPAISVHIKEV